MCCWAAVEKESKRMHRLNIVIAERDPEIAGHLLSCLHCHFRSIQLTHSFGELRAAITSGRIDAIIADLETVDLQQLADLKRAHKLTVICTHRVPDEQMWTAALDARAFDVCQRNDIPAIIGAIQRSLLAAKAAAA